ncbi:MAG: recombination protein RecR [Gammaproteobacteria bacterium]|nr:MAG: recombination protein RecR [Gammaproteobacteria bacterium]
MSSSPSLAELVTALTCLPGVGQKSAQRMALHLIERDQKAASRLANAMLGALEKVGHCNQCRNFSDTDICGICSSNKRNSSILCVVETPADVLAVESSGAFQGTYYVLLGRLSPLDGIGPGQLGLDELENYLADGSVEEIILATSATVEGDITAQFVADIARKTNIKTSRLARGIPLGGELEYVDSGTLSRALSGRQQFE